MFGPHTIPPTHYGIRIFCRQTDIHVPYLLEYKSHPILLWRNFLNTSSFDQRTSSRSLCLLFKLKTYSIAHSLLTTTLSVHLTTPTTLLSWWNIRSISRTLRKAQVKPGLNVRLILRQIWLYMWIYISHEILIEQPSFARPIIISTPRNLKCL